MKLRSLFTITVSLFALLLLWQCYPDKTGGKLAESIKRHHEFAEFSHLSRADQVKKCGSCHQHEYENELKGPHAHAYLAAVLHERFINSSSYDCPFYTTMINNRITVCPSCHAPANLFENIYTISDDYLHLSDSLLKIMPFSPPARSDSTTYITGVDCMTCHFDGKQVVTNANFIKSTTTNCPSYCSPIASRMFTDNMNCYACHFDAVKTMHTELIQSGMKNVSCVSCHEEHDPNGKPTHYMYWRGESLGDKKDAALEAMLDDIKATIKGYLVQINWDNRHFPHQIGDCPEWLIRFKVIDINDEIIGSGNIRLNRKEYHDSTMYKQLGNHNLPGHTGCELSLNSEPFCTAIRLKKHPKQASLKISAISKGQYWFPDSLGVLILEKTIRL